MTFTINLVLHERQKKEIMAAIDTLNSNLVALDSSVKGLTSAVALAIPDINPIPGSGATEAQTQAAADAVLAQQKLVDTQTAALTAATTPPVTSPPTPSA